MRYDAKQMAQYLLARGYGLRNVSTDSMFANVLAHLNFRSGWLAASFEEVRVALAEIEAEAKRAVKQREPSPCNT